MAEPSEVLRRLLDYLEPRIDLAHVQETARRHRTALFYEPLLCRTINQGIADYLSRHGIGSVNELVGTLKV